MNRKQLILIFLALVIIGGAGLVLMNHNQVSWSATPGKMGRKLFPNFTNLDDVASIRLKDAAELRLAKKDGTWRVQERNDYPADFSQVRDLLIKLADLKISQSEPIAASQLAHMQLEAPGKGTNSGLLVEFMDKQGKTLHSFLLGKKHTAQSSSPSPFGGGEFDDGRYVMLPDDPQDVLLVSDPLSSLELNPESWLDKNFFKVDKLQSVSLVSTNATNSWKLTRENEDAPWVLAATNAGETLDSNKVSSLASTLNYVSFVDVASNTAPAVTGLDKPLALSLATFDHFNYELKIGNKTADNNLYMTVAVAADIPTNRVAAAGEKPEDKGKLDTEFQARTKALQEKLAGEKALGQWVYVVSTMQLEPLMRDRSQLLVDKNEVKPAGATGAEPGAETNPGAVGMPVLLSPPATVPAATNPPPAATNTPPAATNTPSAEPPR
jgi:hypothetical protein